MTDTYTPDTPRNRGSSDAPHVSPVTPAEDVRSIMINSVSWGAVFAGVAISLVLQLILNMIGIGIGASTLDVGAGSADNPTAAGLSIGAGVWWTVSGIIAALAGGYVAGRLSGRPKESTAGWHGVTTWALATLIVFYLLTSALGSVIGGAFNTVTAAASGIAQTAGAATQATATAASGEADPFAGIASAITGALGAGTTAEAGDAATAAVRALVTGDPAEAEAAREEAAQTIATAQGIPIEEARTQVEGYEAQYRETATNVQETATEVADTATTAVSSGALLASLALILGGIAGWLGGRWGAVVPTVTSAGRAFVPTQGTTRRT